MRVLVTGGAGFIGSHLVEALAARGDDVVVLDDLSSGSPENLPHGVACIEGDVARRSSIDRIARLRPNAVLHLAAQVSVARSMADPDRDLAVNVVGTRHVLAGSESAGTRRLVFVSSGGAIYGETEGATETQTPGPASYYGVHKLTAERYVALSGMSYGIARLANVYGPRQRHDLEGGVVSIFAERLLAHQPITIYGSGEQRRDFVHVRDVVSALIAMVDTSRDGVWNVGTGQTTSINGLLARLETLTGPAPDVRRMPARPGDIFSSCLGIDRIALELGWRPRVTLERGLQTLLRSPRGRSTQPSGNPRLGATGVLQRAQGVTQ